MTSSTKQVAPSVEKLIVDHVVEVAGYFSTILAIVNTPTMANRSGRFNEAQRLADQSIAELRVWVGTAHRRAVFDAMLLAGLPLAVAAKAVGAPAEQAAAWAKHRSRQWERQ